MSHIAALVDIFPGKLAGETCACAGIDFQAARPAPFGKSLEMEIRFDDRLTLTDELVENAISGLQPFLVSLGQAVAVNE